MIGFDINVLARYYIQDDGDTEAKKQREAARRLMESGRPLVGCKTVLLEQEWVMRGYYKFTSTQIAGVMNHLPALPQVTIEDREGIIQALSMRCTKAISATCSAFPLKLKGRHQHKFPRRNDVKQHPRLRTGSTLSHAAAKIPPAAG